MGLALKTTFFKQDKMIFQYLLGVGLPTSFKNALQLNSALISHFQLPIKSPPNPTGSLEKAMFFFVPIGPNV